MGDVMQNQQQPGQIRRLDPAGAKRTYAGLLALTLGISLCSGSVQAARTSTVDKFVTSYVAELAGNGLGRGWVLGSIDADSRKDFALAVPSFAAGGSDSGKVYVFLNAGISGITGDSVMEAPLTFTGEVGSQLGVQVASGGDLNGDGLQDLAIAAPGLASGAGRVYVFFGRSSWSGVTLGNADVVLNGDQAGQQLGAGGIAFPGDLNGDGLQDLLISSPGRDATSSARDRGAVYVFLGNSLGWTSRTLATADALITGDANLDGFGTTLAAVGDINGDGLADWAASAPRSDDSGSDAGQVYVTFGNAAYALGEAGAGASSSVKIRGDLAGDLLGSSLVGGGDFNGDGVRDLYLGAPASDTNGQDAGRVYVIAGRKRDWPLVATLAKDLSTISFVGAAAGQALGAEHSVTALEFSGDNLVDLVMASRADGSDRGALFAFIGRTSGFGLVNTISAADITLTGSATGDKTGILTGAAGDLDGDNASDLLIGVPGSDLGGTDAGEVLVGDKLSRWLDQDADGFTPEEGDCDDREATANPAQTVDDKDDIDNDCDGQIDEDATSGCGSKMAGLSSKAGGLPVILGFVGVAMGVRRRRSRAH